MLHPHTREGTRMTATTKAPPKTNKKTWRDWMWPDAPEPALDDLLTRDELIDRARAQGIRVGAEDLRNWQQLDAIPYGVRRWRDGATRVLYPTWMVDIIRRLRQLQGSDGGREATLAEIAPQLRLHVRGVVPPVGRAVINYPLPAELENRRPREVISLASPPTAIADDLAHNLRTWARSYGTSVGTEITRVDVSLVDERGRPMTIRLSVDPGQEDDGWTIRGMG